MYSLPILEKFTYAQIYIYKAQITNQWHQAQTLLSWFSFLDHIIYPHNCQFFISVQQNCTFQFMKMHNCTYVLQTNASTSYIVILFWLFNSNCTVHAKSWSIIATNQYYQGPSSLFGFLLLDRKINHFHGQHSLSNEL